MKDTSGLWRGGSRGRPVGSLNKKTRALQVFLQDVLAEAFADPACRQRLLEQITSWSLDPKLLQLVLAYAHGRPGVVAEQAATARMVSLESIIAGTARDEDDDDELSPTH